jgi:hypothetical protein
MVFPNNQCKYESKSVVNPKHYVGYAKLSAVPESLILTYQTGALDYFLRNYSHIVVPFPMTQGGYWFMKELVL